MKFNSLQHNIFSKELDIAEYSLSVLAQNEKLELVKKEYADIFKRKNVKNITFSKDGFFTFILDLSGKVAVSLGESEYIIQGAKKAKEYGVDLEFIPLKKDGTLDISGLDDSFDFIFVSSYIVDTYVKTDLKKIKEITDAKLISNASAKRCEYSDVFLLDSYKLCSLGAKGVLIHDDEFEEDEISKIDLLSLDMTLQAYKNKKENPEQKQKFLEEFKNIFKDDLFIFVDPSICLEFTLHLGLKDIKMRDIIRTLAFEDVFITNGEGCSLGLSRPSRILQEMGYSQDESRWGLSLDFTEQLSDEEIKKLVEKIYKKYRQIKVLG